MVNLDLLKILEQKLKKTNGDLPRYNPRNRIHLKQIQAIGIDRLIIRWLLQNRK